MVVLVRILSGMQEENWFKIVFLHFIIFHCIYMLYAIIFHYFLLFSLFSAVIGSGEFLG